MCIRDSCAFISPNLSATATGNDKNEEIIFTPSFRLFDVKYALKSLSCIFLYSSVFFSYMLLITKSDISENLYLQGTVKTGSPALLATDVYKRQVIRLKGIAVFWLKSSESEILSI